MTDEIAQHESFDLWFKENRAMNEKKYFLELPLTRESNIHQRWPSDPARLKETFRWSLLLNPRSETRKVLTGCDRRFRGGVLWIFYVVVKSMNEQCIKEVQLERIKIALVERISNQMLGAIVEFSESDSFIYNAVDMKVRGYIWGERGKTETIKYPNTWRDAFKERWFPAWLLARYPVNYRIHEISTTTLYPDFKISGTRSNTRDRKSVV